MCGLNFLFTFFNLLVEGATILRRQRQVENQVKAKHSNIFTVSPAASSGKPSLTTPAHSDPASPTCTSSYSPFHAALRMYPLTCAVLPKVRLKGCVLCFLVLPITSHHSHTLGTEGGWAAVQITPWRNCKQLRPGFPDPAGPPQRQVPPAACGPTPCAMFPGSASEDCSPTLPGYFRLTPESRRGASILKQV